MVIAALVLPAGASAQQEKSAVTPTKSNPALKRAKTIHRDSPALYFAMGGALVAAGLAAPLLSGVALLLACRSTRRGLVWLCAVPGIAGSGAGLFLAVLIGPASGLGMGLLLLAGVGVVAGIAALVRRRPVTAAADDASGS
jgi:hypothetical protein